MPSSRKKLLILQTIMLAVFAMVIGIFATAEAPKLEGGISIGYDANAYEARVTTDGGTTYKYYTTFSNAIAFANQQNDVTVEILKEIKNIPSLPLSITKTTILKSYAGSSINFSNSSAIFDVASGGSLTILNGTYKTAQPLVTSTKGGKVTLEGGSFEATATNKRAISYTKSESSTLIIEGNVIFNNQSRIYLGSNSSQIINTGASNNYSIQLEINSPEVTATNKIIVEGAGTNTNFTLTNESFGLHKNGTDLILGKYVKITLKAGQSTAGTNDSNSWSWANNEYTKTLLSVGDSKTLLGVLPENPTKTGYSFNDWWTETSGAGTKLTSATNLPLSNTEYHADWTINKYTVTINSNNTNYGTVSPTSVTSVNHGTTYSASGNVLTIGSTSVTATAKTGYQFSSWSSTSGTITENTTLTATFTARTDTAYTVEHYQQDVSGSGYTKADTDNLTGTTGTTATALAKSYTGFTQNTTHGSRVPSGTIAADGSLVLKLYYDRNIFTVTFNSNGGSAVSSITNVRYGATITKPANPTKQGYGFADWYKEVGLTNVWNFTTDTVTSNITLYARWQPNQFEATIKVLKAHGVKGVTYNSSLWSNQSDGEYYWFTRIVDYGSIINYEDLPMIDWDGGVQTGYTIDGNNFVGRIDDGFSSSKVWNFTMNKTLVPTRSEYYYKIKFYVINTSAWSAEGVTVWFNHGGYQSASVLLDATLGAVAGITEMVFDSREFGANPSISVELFGSNMPFQYARWDGMEVVFMMSAEILTGYQDYRLFDASYFNFTGSAGMTHEVYLELYV